MLIIPAIDLKDGRCVRLTQGRMDEQTVYSENPAQVAKGWERDGAKLIHLVDLNGAVEGRAIKHPAIESIINAIDCPVQIGGGIRDLKTADSYLKNPKIKRIIIGTAAYENPGFLRELIQKYPGRIAVGIDAKDGRVAIKGWVTVTDEKAASLAQRLEGLGVACVIYTDISRDGMLSGPNVEATAELAKSINIPVVASGGISSARDIESYRGRKNIEGIIVGKALYSGGLTLPEAIKAAS